MLRVQRGEHILPKVVQEDDFMTKVDGVVEALSVGHLATAYSGTNTDYLSRSTSCFAEVQ